MEKWLNKNWHLLELFVILAGAVSFAYGAFATKEYVNEKHNGVKEELNSINETLHRIDDRVFELYKTRDRR